VTGRLHFSIKQKPLCEVTTFILKKKKTKPVLE